MISKVKKLIALFVILASGFANAGLVEVDQDGEIAYFIYSSPNKVVRYDMATESFLPDIPLTSPPTAAEPRGGSLYVAYGRSAYEIELDSSESSFIGNSSEAITDIQIVGDALYLSESYHRVTARALSDYSRIETKSFFYSGRGAVSSDAERAIFFRDTGVSPADLRRIPISETGTMQEMEDSPYHGDYSHASQLYLFPSENRVIDNAGIVYFTSDLTFAGSVAGSFDDMAFWQDNLLVRRGNLLYQYNSQLLDVAQMPLQTTPTKLLSFGDSVFAFTDEGTSIRALKLDVAELSQPEPGQPPSPDTLPYSPEFIELNQDTGEIYLLDRESRGLFVWSAESQSYTKSLGLRSPADWMTFSSAHDRLYLGYSNGAITYVDTTQASLTEVALVNLPAAVEGLASAGDFLFAVDDSGAWHSHYSIDESGTIIDSAEWRNPSPEYVWNPVTQRIYHFRSGSSPNDIEWAELDQATGLLTTDGDSPYHSSSYAAAPLHVDPTGQYVLSGAGRFHDATSLNELDYLSNAILDATWVNGTLYTIAQEGGTHYVQEWSSSYERVGNNALDDHSTFHLLSYNDQMVIVAETESGPSFSLVTPDADSDSDGLSYLQDNCPDVSNPSQDDLDLDGSGDACDSDADGDRIPNEVEIANGLDPLDASDAHLDKDGDGFGNLHEYLSGTDISQPNEAPEPVSPYSENFELGLLPANFEQDAADAASWYIDTSNAVGNFSLRSGDIDDSEQSIIHWRFATPLTYGELTFEHLRSAESCCDHFRVLVDGIQVGGLSISHGAWISNTIEIPAGTTSITFIFDKDGSVSSGSDAVWIDNLEFLEVENNDLDEDGIANDIEELYVSLDPMDPTDAAEDYDGDGASNYSEVVSGYNPDEPTDFPARRVMDDYFPLGDIEWQFSNGPNLTIVRGQKLDRDGRFQKREGDFVSTIERRTDGVYLLKEGVLSGDTFPNYHWYIDMGSGLLIAPTEIRLGEVIEQTVPAKYSVDGELFPDFTVKARLQLIEESTVDIGGEELQLLVFLRELTLEFPDGGRDSTYQIMGYAEGIGEVYNSDRNAWEFDDMRVERIDDSVAPEQTSGSGGGGAVSWPLLMLLAAWAGIRRRATR